MLRNKVSQTFIENRIIDFEAFDNFMFEGIRGEACSGCRVTPSPCQCTTACPICWPGQQITMSSSDSNNPNIQMRGGADAWPGRLLPHQRHHQYSAPGARCHQHTNFKVVSRDTLSRRFIFKYLFIPREFSKGLNLFNILKVYSYY